MESSDKCKDNWKEECPKYKNDEVTIKRRGREDRKIHRNWLYKEDTSSPTVSNESLMISCIIDATKVGDVATSDITGELFKNVIFVIIIFK